MKVIQVGIGGMGNAWLRAVQASPHVDFAGFVEVNPEIAVTQSAAYGLDSSLIFASLPEALDAVKAEGVVNVTPPRFHRDVSIMALEAGLPVLSEKPLADTLNAAQEIVSTAERTGVLHMVAQNYRYRSSTQTLARTLQRMPVGPVGAATVNFFRGPHFGGFREEMSYPLVIDMSIHHFDLMRFFLGRDPVAVYGRSWNPPWSWFDGDASTAVTLTFDGGEVIAYNGSWCSQGGETSWNADWRFECAEGLILMVDDRVYIQRTGEEPVPVEPVIMAREGQDYLLHAFYEAVTEGVQPETPCQDNIRSLGIVFDVVKSFEIDAPAPSSI